MSESFVSARGLHVEQGGQDGPLLVLLHGMGANAAVWGPLLPHVEERWPGRWLAPDFRGHGRSVQEGPYGYGVHAADIAELIAQRGAGEATLIGHSFGGLIAALIGTGWFGVKVRRVTAVGVKIVWTAEEIAKTQEIAAKPARDFATEAEAIDRALKVAGLFGLMDAASPEARVGVRAREGRHVLAFDQRAAAGAGPSVETILKLCACPLHLAAGADDPMVLLADMQRVDRAARVIAGAGHNVHWQAPKAVWQLFEDGEPR